VTATAQGTRSQARNRALAVERLQARIAPALVTQRRRQPSKPTKASRERRLESKRRQAQRKRERKPPED
jgi:ribosome-associated protein